MRKFPQTHTTHVGVEVVERCVCGCQSARNENFLKEQSPVALLRHCDDTKQTTFKNNELFCKPFSGVHTFLKRDNQSPSSTFIRFKGYGRVGEKFFHLNLDKMATHTEVRAFDRQAKGKTKLSLGCSTLNPDNKPLKSKPRRHDTTL